MKSRIVLLGPPASGKGTLAVMLSKRRDLPTGSTGAMLRAERERGSKLGREAEEWTRQGRFFPDELALKVVTAWLEKHRAGFILDGFPRTRSQAVAFDAVLAEQHRPLEIAVALELEESEIRKRVADRLTCESCARTFGVKLHGLEEGGVCPECGGRLGRRNDDTLSAIDERLSQHREYTVPVIAYYEGRGILARIDAAGASDAVFDRLCGALGEGLR